jgi:hypothetical protein
MAKFDYNAAAELFPTRRRSPFGYKRFEQAAQAIRFAIEDLPPESLVGAFLEVDEQRYNGDAIRRLYDSADYPLARGHARSLARGPARGPARDFARGVASGETRS